MNRSLIKIQLRYHEGKRLVAYKDTLGNWTNGIGHLLTPSEFVNYRVIDDAQCLAWFDADVDKAIAGARALVMNFDSLGDNRQAVLVDMAFNLGWYKLGKFVNTIKAIERCDFGDAADHMLRSKWAEQVKGRAKTLARMMREDIPFEEARKNDRDS